MGELFITLAHLFRRYEMSLWETTEADMVIDDYMVPVTRGLLKVKVNKRKE